MLGFGRALSLLFGKSAQGHDSERLTSLEETTSSGYPRNFILQRQGTVVVQVPGGYRWVCARCGTMLKQGVRDENCIDVISVVYVQREKQEMRCALPG